MLNLFKIFLSFVLAVIFLSSPASEVNAYYDPYYYVDDFGVNSFTYPVDFYNPYYYGYEFALEESDIYGFYFFEDYNTGAGFNDTFGNFQTGAGSFFTGRSPVFFNDSNTFGFQEFFWDSWGW